MERATIHIEGIVRGVGFRMFVKNSADRLRLKGQVQNHQDLTIEVICEGERGDIQSLIKMIEALGGTMKVERAAARYSAPTGEYDSFCVVMGDINTELVSGMLTVSIYLENILTSIKHVHKDQEKGFEKVIESQEKRFERVTDCLENISVDIKRVHKDQEKGFRSVNERQEDPISVIREQTRHVQDSSLRLADLERKNPPLKLNRAHGVVTAGTF